IAALRGCRITSRNVFDNSYFIDRYRCCADESAAWFHQYNWRFDAELISGISDRSQQVLRDRLDIERGFMRGIRNAVSPTQVDFFQGVSEFIVDLAVQAHDALGSQLEALGIKYLRAHVAMQSHQGEVLSTQARFDRFKGFAGGQRDTKFLILVARRNKLMRMRVHTRCHANKNRLHMLRF